MDTGGMAGRARVAVIDSGVHVAHPHVLGGVVGGVGIDDLGALHEDYIDRLGHGTAVTAVIREKAPNAEILAIKVFNRELSATGAALVAALQWARGAGAHIVNLSLGTTNRDYESALRAEVAQSINAGMVIIAAAPEPDRRWLPGALTGVIKVALDMSLPRERCDMRLDDDGEVAAAACGYPRPIPGVSPERNLKGVSFAVANVTGLVAQAWPEWRKALLPQTDRSP